MEFQFSKRAESFQPNIFNILNEKRQALIESGKKIYNMSVGTPDFPPAQHVLDVVSEAEKIRRNTSIRWEIPGSCYRL